MARICFLFNHDQTHQIAHSLPIALALAENGQHEIVLAVADDKIEARIRTLAGDALARISLVTLEISGRIDAALTNILGNVVPARKILLYRNNLDFFRSFDALVVSEKTSLLLKSRYGLSDLKIIHTRHGAGDRAIGFGKESAEFSLVLVSGQKIADRLIADAGVNPANIRLTGYPKFDIFADKKIANPFPDPSRPTVLYTPHPSPKLSSYYAMGAEVLDAFVASQKYNLIFAPHVMLFQRNWVVTIDPPALRKVPPIAQHIHDCPHILVDLGSSASTDMSYTNQADCYIGDASSQVYEFLIRPRPVLHLDAHNTDWRGNAAYGHWRAGPVARSAADIISQVDQAFASHSNYVHVQNAMLEETFSVTDLPSSQRAASAISHYLTGAGAE